MRLTTLKQATLVQADHTRMVFTGSRGEQLAISVLDNDLIRVEHLPDGQRRMDRTWMITGKNDDMPRQGRSRDDLSPFPCPGFAHEYDARTNILISTSRLRITCALESDDGFHLTWADNNDRIFAQDLPKRAYAYDRAGQTIYHYMRRRSDEHYFGFGERSGPLDKSGMRMRMVNLDAMGYNAETGDPLYKHIPFYITYIPELKIAYGLFYDNLSNTVFDMGKEIDAFMGYYRYYMAEDGDLDYYLIYGPTIDAVVQKFAGLTGYPTLPPRWSLGYLGSTMSYTEAPNSQEQLKQFVALCQKNDIPCDMFHMSSGYTTDSRGIRYVFTWNSDKIPDPQGMVDDFHRAGIRLAPNIKPYLLTSHPDYAKVESQQAFILSAEEDRPEITSFWSGGPFESGDGAYIDFTSSGYDWWKTQIKTVLLNYGIDAIWNDNNEFEIWDDAARCAGFGRPIPISQARPLQTLLMARASYEALQEQRPDTRPFVLSRAGSPGLQRYAQTWSGDNETSWHTLRYNIPMGLGLSLSGIPNTGHDVGGFHGPRPDPELFARWVQNGIFHPRFTIHSWNTDGTVNEPWMHPEVLDIVREAINFRYQLIPYLYALLVNSHRTGQPIIRPLVYHFPDDPRCVTESFDFMLGPNLLVESVLEAGARSRTVYLPAGVGWWDFYSGQQYSGGSTLEAEAPLDRIPLFVPEGGMIPLGKRMRHTKEQPDDMRRVLAFPHHAQGRSTFTLIDDDGISLGYQRGEVAEIAIDMQTTKDAITITMHPVRGGYRPAYAHVDFILPRGETRPVRADTGEQARVKGGRQVMTLQLIT